LETRICWNQLPAAAVEQIRRARTEEDGRHSTAPLAPEAEAHGPQARPRYGGRFRRWVSLRRRRIAGHLQQPRRPRRPRLAATAARRPQERWGGARVDAGSGAVSGASRRAITCRSGGGGSDGSRMCLSHDGGPPLPDDTASPAAAQVTLAVCGSREDCHGD